MIYLIDDKNLRQKDFGWSEEKFAHFSSIIKPLYKIEDITQIGEDLYLDNNIILYHESFLDFTSNKDKALKQREKLTKIAATSPRLSVAFFSGSQGARSLNENIAYIPVSTLYQNLEILVQQHSQGSIELKYLLFGENPKIEEDLNQKLIQANREIEEDIIELTGKTLFFHPDEDFIQNAILEAQTEEIYSEKDFDLTETVLNLLSEKEYNNIFVPLCFGQTLSDYNGLKLATHIRCTPTKNQLKRIFIYGFVGLDYLLEHEYFNILKTKNIHLVPYSKKAFGKAANTYFDKFKLEELSKEIKKLKLDPPLNYADTHSIANEWAIHQWAKKIGCDETEELKKVFHNFQYNLYFKYLKTIHPISKQDLISATKLKIDYKNKTRVLLIDDEAGKGWEAFYSSLFSNSSKEIKFEDSGIDFKAPNISGLIISWVENKVIQFEPDIVLLDLRLLDSDFHKETPPAELTGLKILEKIKEINRGIQVIITTASNKAWNFNLAKQKGAYDFIIKDGFEDSEKAISKFNTALEISCKRAGFLKIIDQKLCILKELIISSDHLKDKDDDEKKPHEIKEDKIRKRMFSYLEIAFELLDISYKMSQKHKYLAYSYLQLFLLIEDFVNPDSLEKQTPIVYYESDQLFISHSLKQICILQIKEGKKLTRLVFDSKYKIDNKTTEFKRKMDTNFFVSSILIYKYGNPNSSEKEWTSVNKVRNNVAHEGYTPNESEIKKLLDFMLYFFNNSNERELNIDKGLVPVTYEESLQALTAKFNSR